MTLREARSRRQLGGLRNSRRCSRCVRRWTAPRLLLRQARRESSCCRKTYGVSARSLKLAIDLNAVPPTGIAGIQPQDKAVERDGQICYGAIGVGGTKMKLHKAAIRRLFESERCGARC